MNATSPAILPTVSVLGCGWLGFPLAVRLQQLGFPVRGSTTTPAKLPELRSNGVSSYLLTFLPELQGENAAEFFQSQVLVITLPFKRSFNPANIYQRQISAVLKMVERSPVQFVVFTSSTSVYPDTLAAAREDTRFVPNNPRAQVLYDVEQTLLKNRKFSTTICRLAGLCGGDRQIGRSLAGQKTIPGGRQPVNLVHVDDCVEILTRILQQDIRGEIFNVCADGHPTREELYSLTARKMGIVVPHFLPDPTPRQKIVENQKIKKILKYQFLHPDPVRF